LIDPLEKVEFRVACVNVLLYFEAVLTPSGAGFIAIKTDASDSQPSAA
jgi:hypothetical protein